MTDDAAVRAAVAEAAAALGGLDVLVNNAGIGAQGTVEDNDDDEWHRVFDVNVVGMVRVTRAALPLLRESAAAAIVNTCSVAATAGLPNRALYSATKGAVLSLTLAMAADLWPTASGSTASCPAPRTPRGSAACSTPRTTRRPSGRPWMPVSRWAGSSRAARGRRGDRLPGLPGRRLDHRHGAAGGRRHAGPAPAALSLDEAAGAQVGEHAAAAPGAGGGEPLQARRRSRRSTFAEASSARISAASPRAASSAARSSMASARAASTARRLCSSASRSSPSPTRAASSATRSSLSSSSACS